MPRLSDLSEGDEALLTARLVEYRTTPSADKEAFRVACAKYIMRTRNLDESNLYLIELFSAKVRNWFQNHTERQNSRLPVRINQSFHPLRIFGHRNRELIRTTLAEVLSHDDTEERPYIVQWNATVRRLWDELSPAEQQPYIHLAELWSVQGPDDDLKPWMAEKRAPAWLRAVASMFWTQCGMPVFIYGMFKDSNGKLRATVYDTTELWADSKPETPLFRNVKGWDQDFRRKAWTFFSAILDPDQASSQTVDLVQATRRQTPATFVFKYHDDGTPTLPPHKSVQGLTTYRRQHILWDFLRIHYSHAMGAEGRPVPWKSLHDAPSKFFVAGMLPEGVILQDPSHVNDEDLIKLFDHVAELESRPDGQLNRFRFSHYETGPKENRKYFPAIYSGTVAPAEPRRSKKPVQVPTFSGSPSDDEDGDDGSRASRQPPACQGPATGTPGLRMASVLESDFARVRDELAAKSVASTESSPAPSQLPPTVSPVPANGKGKAKAHQPWIEAEIEASLAAVENEATDDDLEDSWVPSPPEQQEQPDDLAFPSDDKVEDVLDFSGDPEPDVTLSVASNGAPEPPAAANFTSPTSPFDIVPSPSERTTYLRSLCAHSEYQALLNAVKGKLDEATVIRGKAPVMWATWGHKSGHVPESVHSSEKNIAALQKWVLKGLPFATPSAADVQRYCLVVGFLLNDVRLITETNGLDEWPDSLPGYLTYSQLDCVDERPVLAACQATADVWTSGTDVAAKTHVVDLRKGSQQLDQAQVDAAPKRKAGRGRGTACKADTAAAASAAAAAVPAASVAAPAAATAPSASKPAGRMTRARARGG